MSKRTPPDTANSFSVPCVLYLFFRCFLSRLTWHSSRCVAVLLRTSIFFSFFRCSLFLRACVLLPEFPPMGCVLSSSCLMMPFVCHSGELLLVSFFVNWRLSPWLSRVGHALSSSCERRSFPALVNFFCVLLLCLGFSYVSICIHWAAHCRRPLRVVFVALSRTLPCFLFSEWLRVCATLLFSFSALLRDSRFNTFVFWNFPSS